MKGDDATPATPSALALVGRRLAAPGLAALAALGIGSTGYVMIEGWSWFDALYMSLITLGQVGYGEVQPLGNGGRVWTMGVIVAGFTVLVYSAASLTALFVSGEIKAVLREKRRMKMRQQLHDHVVVTGFGRVGRSAAEATVRSGRSCVVVDTDGALEPAVEAIGAVFLKGDARDATVLRRGRDRECDRPDNQPRRSVQCRGGSHRPLSGARGPHCRQGHRRDLAQQADQGRGIPCRARLRERRHEPRRHRPRRRGCGCAGYRRHRHASRGGPGR